ncbi:hypothetical protein C8R43DRAFT_1117306 [Mycena crocata]|nr:hypothetical protein C8R43DRAFT_1117306 [Mycena crocata]
MSANPAHYNASDYIHFENYADALRDHAAGLRPFLGPTPKGYQEFFCVKHRFTPVPEDYPHLFLKGDDHAEVQRTGPADVAMSTAALGTILDSQHKLMNSVIAMNQQANRFNKPEHDYRPAYFNRGYQRRSKHYGGRGGQGGSALIALIILAMSVVSVDAPTITARTRITATTTLGPSDVATAGGLTDDETEYDSVTLDNSEMTEEGELNGDMDNGFSVAGNAV